MITFLGPTSHLVNTTWFMWSFTTLLQAG